MTTYTSRSEAIQREIIDPLGEYAAVHDIDAIADELIVCDASGSGAVYYLDEDVDFWDAVFTKAL